MGDDDETPVETDNSAEEDAEPVPQSPAWKPDEATDAR